MLAEFPVLEQASSCSSVSGLINTEPLELFRLQPSEPIASESVVISRLNWTTHTWLKTATDKHTHGRMLPSALSPCFAKATRSITTYSIAEMNIPWSVVTDMLQIQFLFFFLLFLVKSGWTGRDSDEYEPTMQSQFAQVGLDLHFTSLTQPI